MADVRMTEERIAEIKARCAEATEGPWAWCNTGDKGGVSFEVGYAVNEAGDPIIGEVGRDDIADEVFEGPYVGGLESGDADFIAHSRTDLPDAIARIEHLEAALRAVMERKGPYSQDQLKHAENTIWNMADLARRGLEGEELDDAA